MMQLPLPTPIPSAGATAFTSAPTLSSTTAPGKTFTSRNDLQQHYKSDWHRYNLKRREAGLPMLNETDFNARLEAAVALRKEREGREERTGVDHRKDKSKGKKEKKNKKQQGKSHKRKPAFAKNRAEGETNLTNDSVEESEETTSPVAEPMQADVVDDADDDDASSMDESQPEINPCQSLFDNHVSDTPELNLEYMQSKFSFYLPDAEYITDLEGFLGYANEKVRLGNMCLYCQKSFASTGALLKHMKDKEHCKILYERGVDQEEFDVFYDFSEANREFLGTSATKINRDITDAMEEDDEGWEDVDDDDGEGWEDASMKEEDDDDLHAAYENEIASHGFDITPLGELIFPDGRIVGHRALSRYYKQRFAPDRTERVAVRHAKDAAGDRLYQGRVVNLYQMRAEAEAEGGGEQTTALAAMGRMAGSIPTGRSGKGILVAGEGKGGFTSLSLYRYRAVVKKQRRDDARGQRLQYRQRMNMNKMDKKGNNIMTGVVTALAPR
mmetsp:Transcript_32755/g.68640  ORF Transcript_32755/g.68640 Transcript_32755/m.68640 type:complete len:499 (-) Transcript_32755:75-1571(-)